MASQAPSVQSTGPRPTHFVRRPDGKTVPLIAIDELPDDVVVTGVPRYLRHDELDGLFTVGTYTRRKARYLIHGIPHRAEDAAKTDEGEASEGTGTVDAQAMARMSAELDEALRFPASDDILARIEAAIPGGPAAARRERAGYDKRYNPTTPGILGRKIFCTHWMRTGECDFVQQGCMFLHKLPDLETMAKLNMKAYPRWFREHDRKYQEEHAFNFDPRGFDPHRDRTRDRGSKSLQQQGILPAESIPDYDQRKPPSNTQSGRHGRRRRRHSPQFVNQAAALPPRSAGASRTVDDFTRGPPPAPASSNRQSSGLLIDVSASTTPTVPSISHWPAWDEYGNETPTHHGGYSADQVPLPIASPAPTLGSNVFSNATLSPMPQVPTLAPQDATAYRQAMILANPPPPPSPPPARVVHAQPVYEYKYGPEWFDEQSRLKKDAAVKAKPPVMEGESSTPRPVMTCDEVESQLTTPKGQAAGSVAAESAPPTPQAPGTDMTTLMPNKRGPGSSFSSGTTSKGKKAAKTTTSTPTAKDK